MPDSPFRNIHAAFADLDKGLLILTPNHRMNVQLLEAYGVYREQQSLPLICASPAIYPVDIWVRNSSEELLADQAANLSPHIILESFQELFLWKKIIRESDVGANLLNQEGTANSIIEAYRIMQQWEIPADEIAQYSSGVFQDSATHEDVDVFLGWVEAYEKYTNKDNIITLSQLLSLFIDAINQGLVKLPEQITLLGFDNPPPVYQRLFQTLKSNCKDFSQLAIEKFKPALEKRELMSTVDEVLAAASWSESILAENPKARIGIICSDLHARENEIQRVFLATFYPESIFGNELIQDLCFSSTASDNLQSQPLIQAALNALKLNKALLPTLEICQLLRSPFLIGAEEEADARAALELRLRKDAEIRCRLSNLRYLALQEGKSWYCPVFGKALLEFEDLRQKNKNIGKVSAWSLLVEQQIALMIDSEKWREDYLQQWYALLKDFNKLVYFCGSLSYSSAINLLNPLARNINASTFFNQASIQIMTPVEASGLQFTHLWFLGLSEVSWPPPARSNPFIPVQLQIKHEIATASAALQYESASALLRQISTSVSSTLVLSYPLQVDDIAVQPTRLLEEYSAEIIQQNTQQVEEDLHPFSEQLFALASKNNFLEHFDDTLNLPLQQDEDATGGTALIANQASCPFKSFALHRLSAENLPKLSYGLPAYAVGNMLHHAMEVFWQTLTDQNSIDQMPAENKAALIAKSANAGVKYISQRYPETMTVRYCEIETQRLSELLTLWLDEESKRGFFTIVKHEYSLQWQYSALKLQFRIDRIEKFEDGSFGLVDYKTSKNNNSVNWFDDRPDKPQLLLYLQAAENESQFPKVSSLLYAQVNIEEMKYRGIAENPDTYPGVTLERQRNRPPEITWDALREHWKQSLEALAQEFLDGYLAIDPKSSSSCQYCHLSSFCRIQEKRQNL